MRITTRLDVIDHQVSCPRSGRHQDVERCLSCRDLLHIEGGSHPDVVVCRPEVSVLASTIDRLMGTSAGR